MNSYRKIGTTLWLHKDGRTYTISLNENENQNRKATTTLTSGILKSPMPGKILKVEAKPGSNVRKGQTLCVIEAMKMEYALKSPFDGKVKDVFKKPGDQVLLEEKVIVLEESK